MHKGKGRPTNWIFKFALFTGYRCVWMGVFFSGIEGIKLSRYVFFNLISNITQSYLTLHSKLSEYFPKKFISTSFSDQLGID